MKLFLITLVFIFSTFAIAKSTSRDCKLAVDNLIEASRDAGRIENGRLNDEAKASLKPGFEEEILKHKLSIEIECGLNL